MLLYKYRVDSERTKDIFRNKEVWFAKPEALNDPFECSIQKIAEKSIKKCCEEEKKEQLLGLFFLGTMSKDGGSTLGVSKKEVDQVLMKIKNAKNLKEKYHIYANFMKSKTGNYPSNPELKYMYITDILRSVGVFSLTETCDNELMWGHYADGGSGIAIGFDIQDNSSITANSLFLKVNYTNEPLVLKDRIKPVLAFSIGENGKPQYFQSAAFDDPFLKTVMSTKNTAWAYEKEWRCVEQSQGLKTVISPITEIVFGLRCPLDTRNEYIALASETYDNSVRFFEMIFRGRTLVKKPLL